MKRIIVFLLSLSLLTATAYAADIYDMDSDIEDIPASVFEETEPAASVLEISISAPSAILIEKETGTVIFEKNADERCEPASVTKVMTILLIVEALESGSLSLDDTVTVSAYAAGMGGSQIYLEEGEQMSVHEMLKSIVVASANDAAVAMAEHLSGTEEAFVGRMNERAAELGMTNTLFLNCSGLLDQPEHLTTSRDVAIMSRELISHDMIKEYCKIWMDTVRGGEFGINNTNKLIYYYPGSTGLKTGFTKRAGYSLAATASRDGVEYIAVVMHCDTSVNRFESSKTLLSFAFANYTLLDTYPEEALAPVRVFLGEAKYVQPVPAVSTPLLIKKSQLSAISKTVSVESEISAPVVKGEALGVLTISDGDTVLAEIPLVAEEAVSRLTWGKIFLRMLEVIYLDYRE